MSEPKTVIIKLNFDVSDFTKQSVLLNREITDINKNQKLLIKQGLEGSLQFQQNKEKLQEYSAQLRENNKVIQNLTIANKAAAGSNEQMKAQLSILTLQYNGLSKAERETTESGKFLKSQIKGLSDELKVTEEGLGDGHRSVGLYAEGIVKAGKALGGTIGLLDIFGRALGVDESLLSSLKDAHSTLISAARDLSHAVHLNTVAHTESAAATEAVTAAEVEQTAATEGATVATEGLNAAMLVNPAVLIIGGIVALVAVLASLSSKTAENKEINEAFSKSFEEIESNVKSTIEELKKLAIEQELLTGKITKFDSDRLKSALDINTKIAESNEKYKESYKKILEDNEKAQSTFGANLLNNLGAQTQAQVDIQNQTNSRLKSLEQAHNADITLLKLEAVQKQNNISQEQANETKKINEETAKKIRENQEKLNADILAGNERLIIQIQNQEVDRILDEETRAKAKEALSNVRAIQEIVTSKANNDLKAKALESQQETHENNLLKIEAEFLDKKQKLRDQQADAQNAQIDKDEAKEVARQKRIADNELKAAKGYIDEKQKIIAEGEAAKVKAAQETANATKQIEQASFNATKEAVTTIFAIKNNGRQSEINDSQRSTNIQIDNLQLLADKGIITQQEFETKSNRIKIDAQKREADLKRKQFESQKRASLIQVGINTAEGVANALTVKPAYLAAVQVGFALVTGAEQIAVINSAPTPAFAKGGKVLSGQKISHSDGSPITRSNGDNRLATVKVGEVILNEAHQNALGGASTFRKIGVPGFASGGFVDGGTFNRSITSPIDQQISATKIAQDVVRAMPPIVVIPKQVNDVLQNELQVQVSANIG